MFASKINKKLLGLHPCATCKCVRPGVFIFSIIPLSLYNKTMNINDLYSEAGPPDHHRPVRPFKIHCLKVSV